MGTHHECVATCVDDILVFSKDPMGTIEAIRKDCMLKGVGKPEHHLGGNFHTTKDFDSALEVNNDDKAHHLTSK